MSKFRIDQDEAGNAEVTAPRPRKVKPLEEEDAPKSAMKKSALKGASSPPSDESPLPPPKSAMKSALKSAATIPEPDAEPAAAPPKPKSALKSRVPAPEEEAPVNPPVVKSAMKRRDPPPEDTGETVQLRPKPPAGANPKAKAKSALKCKQPAPESESAYSSEASNKHQITGKAKARQNASRPSTFKMTIDIDDATAWTKRGLCRHYFHFVAQKLMWEQAMVEMGDGKVHRKSIRVADLVARCDGDDIDIAMTETFSLPAVADAISPLKDLFLAKKPDAAKVKEVMKKMKSDGLVEKWINAPLDATPPPMPSPLVFAVAGVHANLVEVLIEYGVDPNQQYPGKSMLKGWVKPNTPLADSAMGRKGRFVGTMLGDKLDSIERMLRKAQAVGGGVQEEEAPEPKVAPTRRKSVQMKCSQGMIEHTHDHPSSRYELVAHHDDGNPSNVREAINIQSGEVYAIKAGSKIDETSAGDPEAALWTEIGIIRKLDHPNIVRLHETFENDTHIFMVLEGCLGGELFDRLVQEGCIGEQASLRLAYQIGSALRHLHQIQICHRDVQPEAFLLAEGGALMETGVKLVDFSSAKEYSSDVRMLSKVCTLHYVAPEIVTSDNGYTEKVDIWSFGVLLFTMIAGSPPFHDANEMNTLALIKEGKYEFNPPKIWDGITVDVKDLIKSCLTVEAEKRPNFWGIMENSCMARAEAGGAVYTASEKLGRSSDQREDRNASNHVKAAFSMMAEVISDDQVEELRTLFRELDEDNQGMVELEDTVEKIKEMVQDDAEAAELLKLLNAGGIAGRVNYLMYMATMTDRRRQLKREAARAVFNNFDIDKNGNISLYEIAQAISKHEEITLSKSSTVSYKEIQKIWLEMRLVFGERAGQADLEMTFDEFFKLLPSSNGDIGF